MFTRLRNFGNIKYSVAASIAVASMAPQAAHATGGAGAGAGGGDGTIGGIATSAITQLSSVGQAVLAGGAVVGIILMISGLVKLKQAAETQGQQVKYSEGLWRCVVGAGLIAIPALNGVLGQSIGIGGDAVTLSPGGNATF